MAFFVAINVILSFVAVYAPLVSIILIIFLPLTSAVVEINCKDRWFPIYALATIGLSIVVSLSQIDFTLFYVVPSIISGYIFGLFQKKNLPDMFSIFFAAIFQTGFSLAFIPLFNLISGTNFVEIFAKILKISDKNTFISWLACILFLMSLVQTILSFIVVKNELQKMGAKTDKKRDDYLFGIIAVIVSVIIAVFGIIFYVPIGYLFIAISFFFSVFVCIDEAKKKQTALLVIALISCLIGIFVYGIANKYIPDGKDLVLFDCVPFLIGISGISYYFLKKSK